MTGRFIHITDFHPDPHYLAGSSFDSGCHRKEDEDLDGEEEEGRISSISDEEVLTRKKKGKKRREDDDDDDRVAGYWGSSVT